MNSFLVWISVLLTTIISSLRAQITSQMPYSSATNPVVFMSSLTAGYTTEYLEGDKLVMIGMTNDRLKFQLSYNSPGQSSFTALEATVNLGANQLLPNQPLTKDPDENTVYMIISSDGTKKDRLLVIEYSIQAIISVETLVVT